jgi:hypothetical protein
VNLKKEHFRVLSNLFDDEAVKFLNSHNEVSLNVSKKLSQIHSDIMARKWSKRFEKERT